MAKTYRNTRGFGSTRVNTQNSTSIGRSKEKYNVHDDVIKWKHFPRNWPFVRGIHRSPVNSPHKGQWRGTLMFPLICVWINDWVNNCEAGDLRRYRANYDVIVMHYTRLKILIWLDVTDFDQYDLLNPHINRYKWIIIWYLYTFHIHISMFSYFNWGVWHLINV